jgi:twitching motility protein PilU
MSSKDLQRVMLQKGGSGLFLTTGAPPSRRACGTLMPLSTRLLPPRAVKQIVCRIMKPVQIKHIGKSPVMNLPMANPDIGRSRVNIFRQHGRIAIARRNIKTDITSRDRLGLPEILTKLIMQKRDLIVFVQQHKKPAFNQLGGGVETRSYEEALTNTWQQAPNFILSAGH